MKLNQQGFTLIELIVVIVILGILAATALPRFVNLQGDARAASMKGLAGSMRASAELVRGRWLASGSSVAGPALISPGVTVQATAAGFPTSATTGIEAALNVSAGAYTFAHDSPGAGQTTVNAVGATACTVVYDSATGQVTDTNAVAANCGG